MKELPCSQNRLTEKIRIIVLHYCFSMNFLSEKFEYLHLCLNIEHKYLISAFYKILKPPFR